MKFEEILNRRIFLTRREVNNSYLKSKDLKQFSFYPVINWLHILLQTPVSFAIYRHDKENDKYYFHKIFTGKLCQKQILKNIQKHHIDHNLQKPLKTSENIIKIFDTNYYLLTYKVNLNTRLNAKIPIRFDLTKFKFTYSFKYEESDGTIKENKSLELDVERILGEKIENNQTKPISQDIDTYIIYCTNRLLFLKTDNYNESDHFKNHFNIAIQNWLDCNPQTIDDSYSAKPFPIKDKRARDDLQDLYCKIIGDNNQISIFNQIYDKVVAPIEVINKIKKEEDIKKNEKISQSIYDAIKEINLPNVIFFSRNFWRENNKLRAKIYNYNVKIIIPSNQEAKLRRLLGVLKKFGKTKYSYFGKLYSKVNESNKQNKLLIEQLDQIFWSLLSQKNGIDQIIEILQSNVGENTSSISDATFSGITHMQWPSINHSGLSRIIVGKHPKKIDENNVNYNDYMRIVITHYWFSILGASHNPSFAKQNYYLLISPLEVAGSIVATTGCISTGNEVGKQFIRNYKWNKVFYFYSSVISNIEKNFRKRLRDIYIDKIIYTFREELEQIFYDNGYKDLYKNDPKKLVNNFNERIKVYYNLVPYDIIELEYQETKTDEIALTLFEIIHFKINVSENTLFEKIASHKASINYFLIQEFKKVIDDLEKQFAKYHLLAEKLRNI